MKDVKPREQPEADDFYGDAELRALGYSGEKKSMTARLDRARLLELEGRGPLVELRQRLASYGYRPHYIPKPGDVPCP